MPVSIRVDAHESRCCIGRRLPRHGAAFDARIASGPPPKPHVSGMIAYAEQRSIPEIHRIRDADILYDWDFKPRMQNHIEHVVKALPESPEANAFVERATPLHSTRVHRSSLVL